MRKKNKKKKNRAMLCSVVCSLLFLVNSVQLCSCGCGSGQGDFDYSYRVGQRVIPLQLSTEEHLTRQDIHMPVLVVAGKAQTPAYGAAVLASYINAGNPSAVFEVKAVDAAEVGEGKVASLDGKNLAANEAADALLQSCKEKPVAEWKDLAFGTLQTRNFKEVAPALEKIESYLNYHSFFDGYQVGPTDALVWGALRGNGVVGNACKSGAYINLARWYKFVDQALGSVIQDIADQLKDAKQKEKAASSKKKESQASFDIDLVGAEKGKVVTRFPPEPSGFMHIGHAKAAILNEYFARMYDGKLIVRFDDTNPSKEKEEYTEAILEDVKTLGIKPDRITYSSDYFDKMYELAIQMIKEGKAYCDDTPVEKMREERGEGIASARRDRSVEENLKMFEEMKQGTEEGLKNCLRAKISVDDNNKTLRDPVIYRCNLTPHARTGTTWKMYPTYDFCVPIVDSLEGITHALRTIEYRDRNAQYEWMLNALHLRHVNIWDFSRVNFVRTLLSKRKLQWFVDTGRVSGWDDPRFPTVRGVLKRGMSVEGLRQFIISQGPSRNIINLDWSLIWNVNKKVIDPIAPRYTAISDPTPFNLSDDIELHQETRALHKKNPDVGNKQVWFGKNLIISQDDALTLKEGEELTLMDWGNVIVDKIVKDGDRITELQGHLHLEGDFKKTEHKVTWLAQTEKLPVVELVNFDHLIVKDKLEEGDNVEDFLTEQTIFTSEVTADPNVLNLDVGTVIQFERVGYFSVANKDNGVLTLYHVPDGKVVSRYGAKK